MKIDEKSREVLCRTLYTIGDAWGRSAKESGDEVIEQAAGVILTLMCAVGEIRVNNDSSSFNELVEHCDKICDKALMTSY